MAHTSVTLGGSNPRSNESTSPDFGPRLVAGDARDGGGARDRSSGDQKQGGGYLRGAGERAHPMEQVREAGVAGACRKRARSGGRCAGVRGVGVILHGRGHGGVLRAREDALSTVVCSDSSYVHSSHGGDEAQRRRASVMVRDGATACNRDGEEGGSGEELTAVAVRVSAGSGKG